VQVFRLFVPDEMGLEGIDTFWLADNDVEDGCVVVSWSVGGACIGYSSCQYTRVWYAPGQSVQMICDRISFCHIKLSGLSDCIIEFCRTEVVCCAYYCNDGQSSSFEDDSVCFACSANKFPFNSARTNRWPGNVLRHPSDSCVDLLFSIHRLVLGLHAAISTSRYIFSVLTHANSTTGITYTHPRPTLPVTSFACAWYL
jgi:hypothetical protein